MGGKSPSMHAANLLASLSEQMFQESNPARRLMFKQLTEALKTGGVGARIPIIQRAVENVNTATAAATKGASADFARSGLAGSSFAAEALAGVRASGSARAAEIPTDIAEQLISAGPGLISSGSGIPGLSAAASIQASSAAASQAAQSQLISGGASALGSLAGQVGYNSNSGFTFGPQVRTTTG
jgi:hypothetical protein